MQNFKKTAAGVNLFGGTWLTVYDVGIFYLLQYLRPDCSVACLVVFDAFGPEVDDLSYSLPLIGSVLLLRRCHIGLVILA